MALKRDNISFTNSHCFISKSEKVRIKGIGIRSICYFLSQKMYNVSSNLNSSKQYILSLLPKGRFLQSYFHSQSSLLQNLLNIFCKTPDVTSICETASCDYFINIQLYIEGLSKKSILFHKGDNFSEF